MMLYLVGGCSRSGKSLLAERMRVRHGVPWFPLDALKMGLHLGAPSLGVHPDEDDLETADRMWPIVEGVNLRPRTVAKFIDESDAPVRACFLGYPDAVIENKAVQVARYAGPPNDWLDRTGAENVRRYLEISRSLSHQLRDDCYAVGIPFIDTGADFDSAIASAERALIEPVERSSELG